MLTNRQCALVRESWALVAPIAPTAAALLRLAPAALAAHPAGDAASALPLYIRDKVAQTTEERAAERARKELDRGPAAGQAS